MSTNLKSDSQSNQENSWLFVAPEGGVIAMPRLWVPSTPIKLGDESGIIVVQGTYQLMDEIRDMWKAALGFPKFLNMHVYNDSMIGRICPKFCAVKSTVTGDLMSGREWAEELILPFAHRLPEMPALEFLAQMFDEVRL